jgi:hypothetical protein
MATLIGTTAATVDITAQLWVQVEGTLIRVGEMTFDQVTTNEEAIAEVVDVVNQATPFIQPSLRREISIDVMGAP